MRLLIALAGASVAVQMAHAGEAPAIADQPAAASSLLDRLYPTTHPAVAAHHHVASHARPHDAARPVVRTARVDAHEAASPGVPRAETAPHVDRGSDLRLAVLDRAPACDSILCPGYSMLGVGF